MYLIAAVSGITLKTEFLESGHKQVTVKDGPVVIAVASYFNGINRTG